MKCHIHDCSAEATQQLGYTLVTDKGPNAGRMGLKVCGEHATPKLAQSIFNEPVVRTQIETAMANGDMGKPDWYRSKPTWIPLVKEVL